MLCPQGHHIAPGVQRCTTCGRPASPTRWDLVSEKLTVTLDDGDRAGPAVASPAPPPAPPAVEHSPGSPTTVVTLGDLPAAPGVGTPLSTPTPMLVPPSPPAATRADPPTAEAPRPPALPATGPETPASSISFHRNPIEPRVGDGPAPTLEVEEVAASVAGGHGHATRLRLGVDPTGRSVVVPTDERVEARFSFVGGGWGAPAGAEASATLRPLFEGGGEMVVTNRRIAGVSRIGSTRSGPVGMEVGRLVCWHLLLVAVAEIGLAPRPATAAPATGRGLDIWSSGAVPALLRLETVGWPDRPGQHWSEPTRAALQAIVGAACDRRLSGIGPAQRAQVFSTAPPTAPPAAPAWDPSSFNVTAEVL